MNNLELFKVYAIDKKIRCGVNTDGGYVLAHLDGGYDCYISAGISNEESFSRDFINKYNIHKDNSFGFDGTIRDYPWSYTRNIQFFKKNINTFNDQNHSNLSFLTEKYNNIFLKMDIEGGEYPWLLQIDETQLKKFKQIVIEFHGITNDGWGYSYDDKVKVLQKLTNTHYLVHAHANNHGQVVNKIPDVIELTYVNKNYFTSIPHLNTTPLPIPNLDYSNCSPYSDINLNFYPFVHNVVDLGLFEKKIFSQNGEDGVTMKLLELIYNGNNDNKFYVEFGVENGLECNTRILREQYHWKGLQMDGKHENSRFNLKKEFITKENIIQLFKKYNVPSLINVLSVDIDFNDFYCLKEILENYKCDIIICEYNASHLSNEDKIVIYDPKGCWDFSNYYGVSLCSLDKLGKKYNYSLVYCNENGVNCFLIHNDLITNKNLQFKDFGDITKIYKFPKYAGGPNGGHPADRHNRKFISFEEAMLL